LHAHVIPPSGDYLLLFLASLLGSAHCVGMCGPYVALCTSRISPREAALAPRVAVRVLFNAGRIGTYALIGVLAGAFGQVALAVGERAGLRGAVAVLAGLAAVLFGLALLGWVRDPAGGLMRLGIDVILRGGARQAFRRPPYVAATLLGSLQGALPCALVYGAASRAAVAGSAAGGALTMLVFGLGTVPAIFGMSSVSAALVSRLRVWRWAGVFIIAVGVLLLLRGLAGFGLLPHTGLF
jgi:sulfite exporter TauE/SafE